MSQVRVYLLSSQASFVFDVCEAVKHFCFFRPVAHRLGGLGHCAVILTEASQHDQKRGRREVRRRVVTRLKEMEGATLYIRNPLFFEEG